MLIHTNCIWIIFYNYIRMKVKTVKYILTVCKYGHNYILNLQKWYVSLFSIIFLLNLEVDNEIYISPLFQTMNISTISEIDDIITNDTSIQKMTKSSSNIFDLYMQNRSIGEPYYSGPDHVFQDLFYFSLLQY